MADYHTILSRALAGLEENTPEARASVFDRARSALVGQLRSVQPPLAEADITRERLALEDTIRRLDEEARGVVPMAAERAPEPPARMQPAAESIRPRLGPRPVRRTRGKPLWIVVGILAPILVLMGFLAWTLNKGDKEGAATAALSTAPPAATGAAPGRKVGERVGEPASSTAPPPRGAAATQTASAPAQPGIPVAQRAYLLEEKPGSTTRETLTSPGSVAWRLDSEALGTGQPLETVVKCAFEFPEGKLKGSMLFRRNRDPAFPGSHTVEVVFQPEAGSGKDIQAISLIEARDDERQRGVPLAGAAYPVQQNVFLIGLTDVEPGRARNIASLRDKPWFYFEVQFADRRRGAVLLERGDAGRRVFADALDSWKS